MGQDHKERKKDRDRRRAEARKRKQPPPRTVSSARLVPMPELCNRAGAPWGQKEFPCQCEQWPAFIEAGLRSGLVRPIKQVTSIEGEPIDLSSGKPHVGYWRPGGHNMVERFFYDAVVVGAWSVTQMDGTEKSCASVN